jgi:hypothetical protein
VAKPLYDLLKKNAGYDWKEQQQNAFQTLKELLTTAPILQFPDFCDLSLLKQMRRIMLPLACQAKEK